MNAEWWSVIGTVVATLILIVIPGVVYAYFVLDRMIADPNRYMTVMREVDAREEQSRPASAAAPPRSAHFGSEARPLKP